MHWQEIPQWIVATTITAYWSCVLAMVIRSRVRFGVSSGSLPKVSLEKRMWLIWAPTIAAWIGLSWNSENLVSAAWMPHSMNWMSTIWQGLVWIAALAVVAAFVLTTRCWMSMGRNWSMAVTPGKETTLITDGPFARVRHPIYALSLVLMTGTLIVVANPWVLLVAVVHCSMLLIKAGNEERYLMKVHGQQYVEYVRGTSRFVPGMR